MIKTVLIAGGCALASAVLTYSLTKSLPIKREKKEETIYVPKFTSVENEEELFKLMTENAFALLVSTNHVSERTHTTLLPVAVDKKNRKLLGHVAKYNPHANVMTESENNYDWKHIVIFFGPHCYISPTFYSNWHSTKFSVPTWNYVTLQSYVDNVKILEGDSKYAVVKNLSDVYENKLGRDLKYDAEVLDRSEMDKMLKGIVAFELGIEKLVGKFKLSQNKSVEDRESVIFNLKLLGGEMNTRVAGLMQNSLVSDQ
jgi:transcriptional regulator